MSVAGVVQATIIGALLAWSVCKIAGKLAPQTMRRLQARLADLLAGAWAPMWLRTRAVHWQPRSTQGGSCASSCSSCGGCEMATRVDPLAPQVLQFRPRQTRDA
ncbi:DUF6587 family protein [Dokdonella sp.]|uniref:DUF6587 family protein n=1 Tax=Dokdonella sp. TaxID=2291710 RepID=UPI0025BF1AEF|nr:DUF6587 family protein [Dokdonella sp.]MBX3689623.1 hypothetical protein [Dokdonella sp.]